MVLKASIVLTGALLAGTLLSVSNLALAADTAVRLQRYAIPDPNGFEKPLTAMTVLAPTGWQSNGGVVWQPNQSGCGPATPYLDWHAIAPDGVGAVAVLPQETWSGFNYPALGPLPQQGPCPNFVPTTGKDFVLGYVNRYRPNAQVLDYRDITADYADMQTMMQQGMAPIPNAQQRLWIEGGLALIAYQVNGKAVREVVGTAAMFTSSRMPDYMGGYMDMHFAFAFPGFAYRAAEGQLDFKVAEAIRHSAQENPEWTKRMAEYQRKISRINADGARQRAAQNRASSASIAKTNQEILDMQHDSFMKQQASSDYLQRETTEMIRGVETYNDPYHGGTVQLDNTYNNAWQLNDGTYVLTDDPSFQPFQSFGMDGVQLQPTQ